MDRPRAMLCLAGEQVMPNAIAARQLDIGYLLVLHTSHPTRSAEPAKRLAEWFAGLGRQASCKLLEHPDEPDTLRAETLHWLSGKYDWVLNVTGGTKLMSLAATAAGLERGARVCYVDTPRDRLLWLDGSQPPERLTASFSLAEVLALHGQSIQERQELTTSRLAGARLLGSLPVVRQALAKECLNSTWTTGLTLQLAGSRLSQDQARALLAAGVLSVAERADRRWRLQPTSEGWTLCRGAWLEALAAEGLRLAGAHEVVTGLKVPFHHEPGQTKSEADAAAVFGCSLVVAECKAARKITREEFAALALRATTLGGSMALGVMVWAPSLPLDELEVQVQRHREQAEEQRVLYQVGDRPEDLAAAIRQRLGER